MAVAGRRTPKYLLRHHLGLLNWASARRGLLGRCSNALKQHQLRRWRWRRASRYGEPNMLAVPTKVTWVSWFARTRPGGLREGGPAAAGRRTWRRANDRRQIDRNVSSTPTDPANVRRRLSVAELGGGARRPRPARWRRPSVVRDQVMVQPRNWADCGNGRGAGFPLPFADLVPARMASNRGMARVRSPASRLGCARRRHVGHVSVSRHRGLAGLGGRRPEELTWPSSPAVDLHREDLETPVPRDPMGGGALAFPGV